MTDPKVEEIRARRAINDQSLHSTDIDYLLTKLDEAEKANPPVEVGSPDGSQVYEIPLTEYLEQMNANQIFRATQAEEKLAAAEERERVLIAEANERAKRLARVGGWNDDLIAGVREALDIWQHQDERTHPEVPFANGLGRDHLLIDAADRMEAALSRLLPSTPTEEGKNDE